MAKKENKKLDDIKWEWLEANNYLVIIPKEPRISRLIAKWLYAISPDRKAATIEKHATGLSRRLWYKFIKEEFLYGRMLKVDKGRFRKILIKIVHNTKKQSVVATVETSIDELERYKIDTTFWRAKKDLSHLDVSVAVKIRKEDIKKKKEAVKLILTIDQIEEKAQKIGHYIASGVMGLKEACSRVGIEIGDYVDWYNTYQSVREMHAEAFSMSKFIAGNTVTAAATDLLIGMLQRGGRTRVIHHFETIYTGTGTIQKETGVTRTTEEFTPMELINVINSFAEMMGQTATLELDEFQQMSEQELDAYIRENLKASKKKELPLLNENTK